MKAEGYAKLARVHALMIELFPDYTVTALDVREWGALGKLTISFDLEDDKQAEAYRTRCLEPAGGKS